MKRLCFLLGLFFLFGCAMEYTPDRVAISTPKTHAPTGANEAAYIVLGSPTDVVTNGGFDADTDWTVGTNWAIAGGTATKTPAAGGHTIQQSVDITDNYWYFVLYDLLAITDGQIRVAIGAGTGTVRSAAGTYGEIINSGIGTHNLGFIQASSAFDGSIDNVATYDLGESVSGWQTVDGIQGSYDSAITGGKLEVASSGGVIYQEDIVAAGPFQWPEHYAPGVKLYSVQNRPLVILLHAAVAKGKINAQTR